MGQAGERFKKALFATHRPGKYMEAKAAENQANQDREDAEMFRQQAMDLAKQLNWEPDYVSDIMPNYQRAQSPLARSYLESMLTGSNPNMVASTRNGAPQLRAAAQGQFDQQFGGWESLLERQRAAERATPWAPATYGHAPAVIPLGGIRVGPQVSAAKRAAPGWGRVGGRK